MDSQGAMVVRGDGEDEWRTLRMLRDQVNSVVALYDVDEEELVESYEYDPLGRPRFFGSETALCAEMTGTDPTVGNRMLFTGREYEAAAGADLALYHVRHRVYSAGLGRFISRDPIGLAGGQIMYAWAAGDPVNFRDPTGLDDIPSIVIITGPWGIIWEDVGTIAGDPSIIYDAVLGSIYADDPYATLEQLETAFTEAGKYQLENSPVGGAFAYASAETHKGCFVAEGIAVGGLRMDVQDDFAEGIAAAGIKAGPLSVLRGEAYYVYHEGQYGTPFPSWIWLIEGDVFKGGGVGTYIDEHGIGPYIYFGPEDSPAFTGAGVWLDYDRTGNLFDLEYWRGEKECE